MKKTYITRRIDDLGRLVIPKDIRKVLKIKNNDQLEINVVDDKIVLNKYDFFEKDKNISIIINSIKKCLNKNVLFTSRDNIIDYSLLSKKNITNNMLSNEIMNIIEKRKMCIESGKLEIDNDKLDQKFLVNPIIINGDIYGSIIIYGNEDISNKDIEIISFVSIFLENYLE